MYDLIASSQQSYEADKETETQKDWSNYPLKVTHVASDRTGTWNLALLAPEIKLLAKSTAQPLLNIYPS